MAKDCPDCQKILELFRGYSTTKNRWVIELLAILEGPAPQDILEEVRLAKRTQQLSEEK